MAATSGTYTQCGLWRFIGVSGRWDDRLEGGQGKDLSDHRSDTVRSLSFLVERITDLYPAILLP